MSKPTAMLQDQTGLRFACTTFIISLLSTFGPLCTDMYLPALPEMTVDLGVSAAVIQGTITANLLGLAGGQIFIGPISDCRGRRGVLLASLLLFTAGSFLCAFVTSGPALIAMRFLQGLGGAGGIVLSRAICCDIFSGTRLTQYFALIMAINSVAPVLGPVFGGFLGVTFGWQSIFYVLGFVGAFLLVVCASLMPESLPQEKRVTGSLVASLLNTRRLFREKAFLCYLGVQGFTMGGFFSYISASPFIFQNIYGLSVGTYSVLFAVNSLGIMVFSVVASRLSPRFGDVRLLAVVDALRFGVCVYILAVTLVMPSSFLPICLGMFLFVISQGITLTASFSLAIVAQTVGSGAASGLLGVSVFLCGAFASSLVGLAGPMSAVPFGIVAMVSGIGSFLCTITGNRLFRSMRGHID